MIIDWRAGITGVTVFSRNLNSLGERSLRRQDIRSMSMENKRTSIRRLMAVEQIRSAYACLYGDYPSKDSYHVLSAGELEALAERMNEDVKSRTDEVAVLGYN